MRAGTHGSCNDTQVIVCAHIYNQDTYTQTARINASRIHTERHHGMNGRRAS